MGWKQALRSANAAGKRQSRAQQVHENKVQRYLDSLDRAAEEIRQKMKRLNEAISKDVIKAVGLSYSPESGFTSEPFTANVSPFTFSGSITGVPNHDKFDFKPDSYEIENSRVDLLDLCAGSIGTFVALRFATNDPEVRIKLSLIKKGERAESKIYLVDRENGEYYYPLTTDVVGEVVPGVPKSGVIVFERFRKPTGHIELHLTKTRYTKEKFEPDLHFSLQSEDLRDDITESLGHPTFLESIEQQLRNTHASARNQILEAAKKSGGGCMVIASIGLGLAIGGAIGGSLGI